jgi:hypothetical protein
LDQLRHHVVPFVRTHQQCEVVDRLRSAHVLVSDQIDLNHLLEVFVGDFNDPRRNGG